MVVLRARACVCALGQGWMRTLVEAVRVRTAKTPICDELAGASAVARSCHPSFVPSSRPGVSARQQGRGPGLGTSRGGLGADGSLALLLGRVPLALEHPAGPRPALWRPHALLAAAQRHRLHLCWRRFGCSHSAPLLVRAGNALDGSGRRLRTAVARSSSRSSRSPPPRCCVASSADLLCLAAPSRPPSLWHWPEYSTCRSVEHRTHITAHPVSTHRCPRGIQRSVPQ